MKQYHDGFKIKGITALAALACLLILSGQASAQRPPSSSNNSASHKSGSQIGMEQDLRLRGAVADKAPVTEDKLREILKEINEDFTEIQVVNDNIMRMVRTTTDLNYTSIVEMTGEMRKRAKRFKDNANFPPPAGFSKEEKRPDDVEQKEMKEALLILNGQVNRFVDNPLFQKPEWTDMELAAKASRDLDIIIEMSGQIKKNAEKLVKPIQ
jgi:hypothetical protein